MKEGAHLAGYGLTRAMDNLKWLLEDERFKQLSADYNTVNDFLRDTAGAFSLLKIDPAERKQIAKTVMELTNKEASQRAIADMVGTSEATVARDLGKDRGATFDAPEAVKEPEIATFDAPVPQPWTTVDFDPTTSGKRKAQAQVIMAPAETPPLPEGKHNIIYADPPWRYDFSPTASRKVERHYRTMEIDEICSLMKEIVDEAAADNCTLFMWGTSPKLNWAFDVIDYIGFDYKSCMVWVKDKIGMGFYARQQHELLLIAGRGESQLPEPSNRPSSVIEAPRLEHSAKPEIVFKLLEEMYPDAARIQLFARKPRKGWTNWGAECDRDSA